jgi:hypothetical protein
MSTDQQVVGPVETLAQEYAEVADLNAKRAVALLEIVEMLKTHSMSYDAKRIVQSAIQKWAS